MSPLIHCDPPPVILAIILLVLFFMPFSLIALWLPRLMG